MKRIIGMFCPLVITFMFGWWFVAQQNWSHIWTTLAGADMRWVMIALLLVLLGIVLRVLRWKIMIKPVTHLSFTHTLGAMLVSFFANNVLPLRTGEFVRPVIIKVKFRGSFLGALTTVVAERLLDILTIVGLFVLLFLAVPLTVAPLYPYYNFLFPVAAVLLIAGFSAIMIKKWHSGERPLRKVPTFVKGIRDTVQPIFDAVRDGFSFMKQSSTFFITLIYSLIVLAVSISFIYVCALAFHFNIGLTGACFTVLAISAVSALPQAPGSVGTFHWAAAFSGQLFDMTPTTATGFALLTHVIIVVPETVAGFVALGLMGLTFDTVRKEIKKNSSSLTLSNQNRPNGNDSLD
jgi:uncharacterized protein (TIRG00374 family)